LTIDGVTTALATKNYLESNGIKVVDAEIIQYGDKEFAVKKTDAKGDTMPVLVDFAHGKPMFVIHTDHHDSQTGVEGGTATSFRPSRSNVATISQIVSPKEIFPSEDITLISTVDSADFARFGLTPDDIMNFIFKVQKDKSLQKNKMALGLATNKLLLAYKNKPGFLEELVMTSTPSLLNIFQNINRIAAERGYALPEEMELNQKRYVQKQRESQNVKYEDGIIIQYGGGSMVKPGSYDRYTPFKNHPDADFLVIAWPMGLVQASCNPFKKERELKGVNLGEIAQEVLAKWEPQLKDKVVPLSTIKWISESSRQFGPESVGFTNADLEAFYGDKIRSIENGDEYMEIIKNIMDKPYMELTDEEWAILDRLGVPAWEIIQANSGGHKCITNISSLNYFGRSKRPPEGPYKYDSESDDAPYVKFAKMIQAEFVRILKEKIAQSKKLNESAEYLRNYLDDLDIDEKQIYSDGELTSAGEITDNLSEIAVELFKDIRSKLPSVKIRVTAGNDAYHSNKGGLHPQGKAIDFTVEDYSKYAGTINDILEKYKNTHPGFNYLDEYVRGSRHKTGGHFHFSYDEGNEAQVVKNLTSKLKTTIDNIIKNNDNRVVIAIGSVGKGVEEIQQILKDNGYNIGDISGQYDSKTKKAVIEFQKDNKLKVDGIVGIETSKKLKEVASQSEEVNEQKNDPKKGDIVGDDVNNFLNTLKDFDGKVTQEGRDDYNFQKIVETFQIGLELLGYNLPRYGVDGLFGIETATQLNKFKDDNEIKYEKQKKSTFDQETAFKMYELLKDENLTSKDIRKYLDITVGLEDYEEELQNAGVESLSDSQFMKYFFDEIFKKLGITPTEEKFKFFVAWRQAESGSATYNPFNTTKKINVPGVSNYNSVGVKNYPDMSTGIMATVNTLKLPYYVDLMDKLRDDSITAKELASTDDLDTWGTGDLVLTVLSGGRLKPKPIARV